MAETAQIDGLGIEAQLEAHRVELTGYCYRMLGSAFEAEDAVQETLVRAWRGFDRFEGRASLRSWLYRIATNVCIDLLNDRKRRVLPMDLQAPSPGDAILPAALPEATWVQPILDRRAVPAHGDPGDVAAASEAIRLAFVAALQHLPPTQRAVLILRDVLRWKSTEVATLLDTTVFSVKSALQRARATMASKSIPAVQPAGLDAEQAALLARYVDAFERYDIEQLVTLLHDDATMSMPPVPLWLRGTNDIRQWMSTEGAECRGSRMVPLAVNGAPAFAQYRPRPKPPGDFREAFAIHVLDVTDYRISAIHCFVDANLFELFGLPLRLEP
ncbi:MAG: sigma-70 family RNA polymerase sigma factor [Acidimicrobiales bacterium]